MEISQSSVRLAAQTGEIPVEGRVEAVKDGVAQVRVSPTQVVAAVLDSGAGGAAVAVGSKVVLQQRADGTVLAKSAGAASIDLKDQALQLLLDSLRELVGEAATANLAKPLAAGDLETARKQIAQIWKDVQGLPPEQVAPPLRAWLEKQAPALLSRPGEAPALTGSVALKLGAPAAGPNEYLAEVAGQPARLLGPPGLEAGSKGIWQARPVPGGGALWAPQPVTASVRPEASLPQRVAADGQGAAQLLEWAGVEATPEASASLGRFLEKVAATFGTAGDESGETAASNRAARPGDRPVPVADQTKNVGTSAPVVGGEVTAPAAERPAAPDLPRPVAQRALVAWALDLPDEPVVRQAVVAQGPALPEALGNLSEQLAARPGTLPTLETLLHQWHQQDWVAPAGLPPKGHASPLREKLAEAVMEALAGTDTSKEQEPLRQSLQRTAAALVQESLDPPREGARQEPPAVFQARGAEGRMEEGRIVVRDRRSRRRENEAPADHHAVDIEMKPAALGPVKAHLELRGKVLTTRLEAKEEATAKLIESRVDELREAFRKIGLEPAVLEVRRPDGAGGIDPRKRGSGLNLDLRV